MLLSPVPNTLNYHHPDHILWLTKKQKHFNSPASDTDRALRAYSLLHRLLLFLSTCVLLICVISQNYGSFKCALEIRICFALSGRHLCFHEISQLHWTSRWAEVWCVGTGTLSFLTCWRSLSRIWKGCTLLRASTWEDPGFDSAGRERVGASFTVIFFWSHRSSTDIVEAHFTFHLYLLQQKWGLDLGYL